MIKTFEGGRGLAALIVALFHVKLVVAGPFKSVVTGVALLRNGYLMVDLFFVLSGFLMAANYARRLEHKAAFQPFLLRRIGRLLPLLVFSTVLYVLALNAESFIKNQLGAWGFAVGANGAGHLAYLLPTLAQIVATLTMTQSMGVFDKLVLNFASWSVSVEFYTYILFAGVCFMWCGRRRLLAFGLLAILASWVSAWGSIVPHDCRAQYDCLNLTYDFGFFRCVSAFFLGALASSLRQHLRFSANLLQAGALLLLTLVFVSVERIPLLAFLCPPLFALLVLSIHHDDGGLARLLTWAPLQVLGQRSYSIYLMHPPILLMFWPAWTAAHGHMMVEFALLAAYVVVVLRVSGWTYKYIEDPSRRWVNHFSTGRTGGLSLDVPAV